MKKIISTVLAISVIIACSKINNVYCQTYNLSLTANSDIDTIIEQGMKGVTATQQYDLKLGLSNKLLLPDGL
jgi:hypothetical protein